MTHVDEPQRRQIRRAKARMSTAAVLLAATVFGIIALGVGLYLGIR